MRRVVLMFSAILLICSCSTNPETNDLSANSDSDKFIIVSDSITKPTKPAYKFDPKEYEGSSAIWVYDSYADKLVKIKEVNSDTLTVRKLLRLISSPKIKPVFVKKSNDTIYIKIPDSFYLTQSIGSTGAKDFISVATFTLTELRGVKYVRFDFEEGDHASPGTFNRAYFEK